MSIIAEALKRAEKERNKAIASKEYMNKILGPQRKETFRREEFKGDKAVSKSAAIFSEGEKEEFQSITDYIKNNKVLISAGGLVLSVIIFLTIVNTFLFQTPGVKTAAREKMPAFAKGEPLEAEAYTDMNAEIVFIENKSGFMDKVANVFKGSSVREQFISKFTLNGIVWDIEDSWAVINNKIVRAGDIFEGAEVVSIEPQKATLIFKDEKFDLAVK